MMTIEQLKAEWEDLCLFRNSTSGVQLHHEMHDRKTRMANYAEKYMHKLLAIADLVEKEYEVEGLPVPLAEALEDLLGENYRGRI